jgi:hypothetical protein
MYVVLIKHTSMLPCACTESNAGGIFKKHLPRSRSMSEDHYCNGRVDNMTQITLTDEELDALLIVLQSTLADMSYEIADTDRVEFRNQLKARRGMLQDIKEKLENHSK